MKQKVNKYFFASEINLLFLWPYTLLCLHIMLLISLLFFFPIIPVKQNLFFYQHNHICVYDETMYFKCQDSKYILLDPKSLH